MNKIIELISKDLEKINLDINALFMEKNEVLKDLKIFLNSPPKRIIFKMYRQRNQSRSY